MSLAYYDAAGDPLTAFAFTALEAGVDSDVLTIWVWNDKGSPGGADREDIFIPLQLKNSSGVYVTSGVPALDELWGLYRIVSVNNAAVPSWSVAATVWLPLGANAAISIDRIPADCGVEVEIKMHPPPYASPVLYEWRLPPIYGEYSRVLAPLSARLGGRGIIADNGDRAYSYLLSGYSVAPSSPEDDFVQVAAGIRLLAGDVVGEVSEAVQLDQNDESAAALTAGNSYLAILSRGTHLDLVTVTKSDQAVDPILPTAPVGESVLAVVSVDYQAGGTSVIDAADIDLTAATRRRWQARVLSGLDVEISAGEAAYGSTYRRRGLRAIVAAVDDDASTVWSLADGSWEVAAVAPAVDAMAVWRLTAVSGSVTLLEDLRAYAGPVYHLALRIDTSLSEVRYWDGPAVDVEAVVVRISDNGGGSSGQTVVDVEVATVSLWETSSEDLRAAFAFDTSTLKANPNPLHQYARILPGDDIVASFAEEPTGGSPATCWITLICRG